MDLFVEPTGGIAGDMFLAALLDLGAPRAPIDEVLSRVGLSLVTRSVATCGVVGLQVAPIASDHTHRNQADIAGILHALRLPPRADALARQVYEILIAAEATVHGEEIAEVHLHEVGALDSVLDVVGVAMCWDALGVETVAYSPLPSGGGYVATAHGKLACPVPAVREIAERHGIAMVPDLLEGEAVTPTGIALLAAVRARVGRPQASARQGIGVGTRSWSFRPNILKVSVTR